MTKPCTCHPDDEPPVPCEQRYALTECRQSKAARVVFEEMNRDPGKFYPMETCALAVQFAEALIKAELAAANAREVGLVVYGPPEFYVNSAAMSERAVARAKAETEEWKRKAQEANKRALSDDAAIRVLNKRIAALAQPSTEKPK